MNSCQLTIAITALANGIAKNLTIDEIGMLSAVLVQLGDTLATIATQNGILESAKNTESMYTV